MNAKKVRGIVDNILNMGMLRKTDNILGVRSCNNFESL